MSRSGPHLTPAGRSQHEIISSKLQQDLLTHKLHSMCDSEFLADRSGNVIFTTCLREKNIQRYKETNIFNFTSKEIGHMKKVSSKEDILTYLHCMDDCTLREVLKDKSLHATALTDAALSQRIQTIKSLPVEVRNIKYSFQPIPFSFEDSATA